MQSAAFESRRITRTSVITLSDSPEEIFPLFGPVRERVWAPGWDPTILYPRGVLAEEHLVFTARSHHENEAEFTWTISKYHAEDGFMEYTVFAPERLWTIVIRCRPGQADRTTRAEITYTYTGLTENGNRLNEEALRRMFHRDLRDWEEQINRYLEIRQPSSAT